MLNTQPTGTVISRRACFSLNTSQEPLLKMSMSPFLLLMCIWCRTHWMGSPSPSMSKQTSKWQCLSTSACQPSHQLYVQTFLCCDSYFCLERASPSLSTISVPVLNEEYLTCWCFFNAPCPLTSVNHLSIGTERGISDMMMFIQCSLSARAHTAWAW